MSHFVIICPLMGLSFGMEAKETMEKERIQDGLI
jgi:hypothetical protein